MKKIAKIIAAILFVVGAVYGFYSLYKFYKRHKLDELFKAWLKISGENEIIDIDGQGVRFIAKKNKDSEREIEAYMARAGFVPMAKYGRSSIYECGGEEVIVKRIDLFNAYTIFEIYNETYFGQTLVA